MLLAEAPWYEGRREITDPRVIPLPPALPPQATVTSWLI
jgi:hypothetical protein